MDKYIEIFCEHNPVMEMECGDEECNNVFKVESKEFFKDSIYSIKCEKCNKTLEYDSIGFLEEYKKLLENMDE